jgi:hypothetical protein
MTTCTIIDITKKLEWRNRAPLWKYAKDAELNFMSYEADIANGLMQATVPEELLPQVVVLVEELLEAYE